MKTQFDVFRGVLTTILAIISLIVQGQLTLIIDDIPENSPPNASIYLAANINQWNPADNDYQFKLNKNNELYLVLDSLNVDDEVVFKFTLGTWDLVELNLDGSDKSNRTFTFQESDTLFLSIDAWHTPTSPGIIKSTASYNVEVISDSFYMPQLNRYRRIWIYLPPDYTIEDDEYPVLYMHDGQNLFDVTTSYSGEWRVDESLNELFEEGAIVPIVIGIDHGEWRRLDEYTMEVAEGYSTVAEGELYLDFLVNTLKPYVDSHYRTKPQREFTGIMGSSLGGLISSYAILNHSDVFGLAGLFSSAYWLSESIFLIPPDIESPMRIFELCGSEEEGKTVESIVKMDSVFVSQVESKENIYFEVVEGGKHNEQLWSDGFKDAILFLFKQ